VGGMTAQPIEADAVADRWPGPDLRRQRLATYTIEDVVALPDDAPRVELRDGVMIVVPSPTIGHQEIGTMLWLWFRNNSPREFRPSVATGLAVSINHTLEPDVLLVRSETINPSSHFSTVEQIVIAVEIVSPGTKRRDLLEKPADYAGARVPYFWRIEQDPVHLFAYELVVGGTYKLLADSATELVIDRPFEIRLPIGDITP